MTAVPAGSMVSLPEDQTIQASTIGRASSPFADPGAEDVERDDVQEISRLHSSVVRWGRFHRMYLLQIQLFSWLLFGIQVFLPVYLTMEPPRFPICDAVDAGLRRLPADIQSAHGHARSNPLIPADSLEDFSCDPNRPLPESVCHVPHRYWSPHVSTVADFDVPHSHCELSAFKNISWTESAFFLGFLIGVVLLGPAADRYGRRRTFLFSITLTLVAAVCTALATNISLFGLSRLVDGIGVGGGGISSFILFSETTDKKHRQLISASQSASFALGGLVVSFGASFIPSWRMLVLVVTLPGFLIYPLLLFSPVFIESPRWQIVMGDMVGAVRGFSLIAAMEGRQLHPEICEDNIDVFALIVDDPGKTEELLEMLKKDRGEKDDDISLPPLESEEAQAPVVVKRDRLSHIFTKRPFSKFIYALFLVWFSTSLSYYGIYLDTKHLSEASVFHEKTKQAMTTRRLFRLTVASERRLPEMTEEDPAWVQPSEGAPPQQIVSQEDSMTTDKFGEDSVMALFAAQFDGNCPLADYFMDVRQVAVTTLIASFFEIPCAFVSIYLAGIEGLGRRGISVSFLLMSGLLSTVAFIIRMHAAVPSRPIIWLTSGLANLAKLFAGSTYNLLYLYSSEIFPTSVRSGSVGVCSMCARISAMLAPEIVEVAEVTRPGLPLLIFGVTALVSGAVSWMVLPETLGTTTHDTITQYTEDLPRSSHKSMKFRWFNMIRKLKQIRKFRLKGKKEKYGLFREEAPKPTFTPFEIATP